MKTYIIDMTTASIAEPVEHFTKTFYNIEEARSYIEESEREWLNYEFKTMRDYLGYDEDDIDNWLENSLCDDIDNYDYIYKHYVYDGGEEKVFELREESIENFSVFAVVEDYIFMNDIYEKDRTIHMITTSFQKALARAFELKNESQKEFEHYEEYEELDMKGMDYQYTISNEYDQININIERHEVI